MLASFKLSTKQLLWTIFVNTLRLSAYEPCLVVGMLEVSVMLVVHVIAFVVISFVLVTE